MAPHFTYYIKVSGYNPFNQNAFYISTGDGVWSTDWTISLDFHGDCSNQKIYKFDQSDPSNLNHPFNLSTTQDGTHSVGTNLGTGDGVTLYGTPGVSGASTKFNVGQFISGGGHSKIDPVYPFCPNHANMGTQSSFDINEMYGDPCTNGDYSGEACGIESYLSGELQSLIDNTNVELSGQYDNFTTLSYNIETGYNTGSFLICEVVGTGVSQVDADARRQHLSNLFYNSGICTNDVFGISSQINVNNVNMSFNTPNTFDAGTYYESHVSGFADKKYYVTYTPTISGQKTKVSADVNCPNTNLRVSLTRDKVVWTSTGVAAKESGVINQVNVTLNANCQNYETSIDVDCNKVENGAVKYCEINIPNNGEGCWESEFESGNYAVKYKSGAYTTQNGDYMLGTGILKVNKFI